MHNYVRCHNEALINAIIIIIIIIIIILFELLLLDNNGITLER